MTKIRGMLPFCMMKIQQLTTSAETFLPGNRMQVRLAFLALLLNRNVLIEDVPGMGKTTLVKFFAKVSGLQFRRIQFTSDLLPSDILGVSVFSKESERFTFKPGPIFGELILADELNRGTPKTQSALLQAMEEKQVTMDGESHQLPDRFCIFATQNPRGQFGTYPLPESQLDRFLFKFSMGQLTRSQEMELLKTGQRLELLDTLKPIFDRNDLKVWQEKVRNVSTTAMLLEYVAEILQASRGREHLWGLSPRAGLDLLDAARAWAFLENREYCVPDDVQAVFPFVAAHRMFSYQSLSVDVEQARAREFVTGIKFVNNR